MKNQPQLIAKLTVNHPIKLYFHISIKTFASILFLLFSCSMFIEKQRKKKTHSKLAIDEI